MTLKHNEDFAINASCPFDAITAMYAKEIDDAIEQTARDIFYNGGGNGAKDVAEVAAAIRSKIDSINTDDLYAVLNVFSSVAYDKVHDAVERAGV